MTRHLFGLAALAATIALAQPQPEKFPLKYERQPDLANVKYGPYERNVMDIWKAKSDRPTPLVLNIHGGGFIAGDKSQIQGFLLEACLAHGISVATMNYRFANQSPYPAPMEDGARAIQYLRWRAKELNLNPNAFAAEGGSAGAGIALWIGFRKDMADPASDDPVKRQSTRLSVIGSLNGQTAYDPRIVSKIIDEATGRHPAFSKIYGLRPDEMNTERAYKLFDDASAVTLLTGDAPPVYMFYSQPLKKGPPANLQEGIHDARFGVLLKERMDKLGIECELHLPSDYKNDPLAKEYNQAMVDFFVKHFPK
jgi:acetyl esterase/lipase